ncbi:MAG: hypothetical protein ACRBDX_08605 [Gammaproteobacteria bacterium]
MDGNSANKAPVLDNLVATENAPTSNNFTPTTPPQTTAKPTLASMNGAAAASNSASPAGTNSATDNPPQNRRTDKSQFEIELTKTVNRIMLKHFEHASEQIVQQVLSEVRARLPGQRKS